MHLVQTRYGTEVPVITCGGKLAPVSPTGYSGCQGSGKYSKGKKCFRCAGWGFQSKQQFNKNIEFDNKRRT